MTKSLVRSGERPSLAPSFAVLDERHLFESFLEGRSPTTRKAYGSDLENFAHYLRVDGPTQAITQLLAAGAGPANAIVLKYRNYLREKGHAPATINRRLATLRSATKLSRMLGHITWSLEVEGFANEAYRDTRGPGLEILQTLFQTVEVRRDPKGLRDYAICHLLFDLGLRRGEVVDLDVDCLSDKGLSILGKGRLVRETLTVPATTQAAIVAWLKAHPSSKGTSPMFIRLDSGGKGERLTGHGLYVILQAWGGLIGSKELHPHGIRHTAITEVLNQTNGNLRIGQSFGRHKNANTTARYDDARHDHRGNAAETIANLITKS